MNDTSIPAHTIALLIQWGSSQDGPDAFGEDDKATLARHDEINCLHWRTWNAVTDDMDVDSHEALIRGLAFAEKECRWIGGSVSAVIWTYRSFARKAPDRADMLAEWLLQYSDNPWVPFGSNRGNARSVEEIKIQNLSRGDK